jgi:2-methylisocitrate lyase-like PEP mutase family enzyme
MKTQEQKAIAFRDLHNRSRAFIIPNPWDTGTAILLASIGFEALATTSAGLAFSLGRPDGGVSREELLKHCRDLASATDLPISADLEKCYADSPDHVGEMIHLAAATGVVGGSIEDATGDPNDPIFDFELAVARVRAAVEAARSLPIPFTLTARAENFLHGRKDMADTIRRLKAFEAAGADVLYAPGLTKIDDIREICSCVEKPVNVLMGFSGAFSVAELASVGVQRISVGGALARAALNAFLYAAREMHEQGTFNWTREITTHQEVNELFKKAREKR